MNLTVTGYSTALFSTWYFIEELGILFDCGDGVTSTLLQKSRKIDHVFISHADRDHLTGLLQLNQLNARPGYPVIYHPRDSGSFPAIADFSARFDPHVKNVVWKPVIDGDKIWIRKDMYAEAVRNNHVPTESHIQKSLGYKIVQVKMKLKDEYINLPPLEIKSIIEKQGKADTHREVLTTLIAYSGDTPVENFSHWQDANILIHEATFLGGAEDANIQTHGNKHSQLDEVIKAVSESNIGSLVLGHFSSRYSDNQIDTKIKETCKKYNLKTPVYRVLPGQTTKNILEGQPVYK